MKLLTAFFCICLLAEGRIWFKEDFNDDSWRDRWVISDMGGGKAIGKLNHTAGSYYGNIRDKGMKTAENNRFYALSAEFEEPFTNRNSDLIIQMSAKNEHDMLCGGMYIKLFGKDQFDQHHFSDNTPYQIMFGPDICGANNSQTHAIFYYERKLSYMHHVEKLQVKHDKLTHLYTLWIRSDNSYEFFIDKNSKSTGNIDRGWGFHEPREIPDPHSSKPDDWVEDALIVDSTDVKPEGWDDTPFEIPDPNAVEPVSWNAAEKGPWEPPSIPNPDYFGKWQPRWIENPDYKGEWQQPMIPNPKFIEEDAEAYIRCLECSYVGFDLWQQTAGTIFDDIMISDSFDDVLASWKVYTKKRRLEDQMYMQKVDKTKEKIEALTRQREAEEKSKSVQAKAPKAAQAQTEVHTAGDDWRNEYDDIVLDDMRDILVQEDQRAADNDNVDEDIVQALNPDLAMEDNYIMSTDREL